MAADAQSTEALRSALRNAYMARARFFVSEISKRTLRRFEDDLAAIDSSNWDWSLALGMTSTASERVRASGIQLHNVFIHPQILTENVLSLDYYRNLAAISRKGFQQLLKGIRSKERPQAGIRELNTILSGVVEGMDVFDLNLLRLVVPAELGTEIQGAWVNVVGSGAAQFVKDLIKEYASRNGYLHSQALEKTFTELTLTNDWKITFGSEPDIAIRNPSGLLAGAVEIKGSKDVAGAQTRYGEAKKSFGKALRENGQCETIYLASCSTPSVANQIANDPQVRKYFDLIEIMADDAASQSFLSELFEHIIRV